MESHECNINTQGGVRMTAPSPAKRALVVRHEHAGQGGDEQREQREDDEVELACARDSDPRECYLGPGNIFYREYS